MNGFSLNAGILHAFQYFLRAVLRNFYEGVFVIHVNASHQTAGNAGLTCDSPQDITWFYLLFFSDIDEQACHICVILIFSGAASASAVSALAVSPAAPVSTVTAVTSGIQII